MAKWSPWNRKPNTISLSTREASPHHHRSVLTPQWDQKWSPGLRLLKHFLFGEESHELFCFAVQTPTSQSQTAQIVHNTIRGALPKPPLWQCLSLFTTTKIIFLEHIPGKNQSPSYFPARRSPHNTVSSIRMVSLGLECGRVYIPNWFSDELLKFSWKCCVAALNWLFICQFSH